MSNDKIKIYKNRSRNQPEPIVQPYLPQYQSLGVEPQEYKSAMVPATAKIAVPSEDNPRTRKATIRHSYAESLPSPVGRGKGPIPNVGNNVEHTWSGVDGDGLIMDDLSEVQLDPNHPMIDNNDYVIETTPGLLNMPEDLSLLNELKRPSRIKLTHEQVEQTFNKGFHKEEVMSPSSEEDLFLIVRDLVEGAFLLIVNGVPICSGPKEEIEEQARLLVFGEHEMCDGTPVPDDDILVIRRVPIKIGLFLE